MDQATLDAEYNARATVPDYEAEARRFHDASAAARAACRMTPDLVYDAQSGNALDWFPGAPGGPAFLWVHGGYWRALGREDNHCVAPGLVAAGAHVAVMDYTLAPGAELDEIVRQVRAAYAWVTQHAAEHGADPGRMYAGGSSAGGHLVGMLLVDTWVGPHLQGVVALSGLFDLEPVRLSNVNEWMHLDGDAVARLSPVRHIPRRGPAPRLLASYGGSETSEFKRQTEEFAAAWAAAGHDAAVIPREERNHFDLVVAIGDGADPLCRAVAGFMDLG